MLTAILTAANSTSTAQSRAVQQYEPDKSGNDVAFVVGHLDHIISKPEARFSVHLVRGRCVLRARGVDAYNAPLSNLPCDWDGVQSRRRGHY